MRKNQKCPICGSQQSGKFRLGGWRWCHGCQTAWRRDLRRVDYRQDYYEGRSSLAARVFKPLMNFFYLVRRLYAGLGRKNLWIDVGAGEGAFLASVEAKRRIGVEASPVARKILAEKKLEVIGERQFLKSQGLGADVISFWHVLEHTDEPWEYLAAVWRNLRKGGRLIVGVPNIDSLEFDLFGRHWFHLAPSYHIWHFSLRSLKILLERQNFKIEMVDFWSVEHQLAGIIQTLVNWSSGTINILHRLVRRNAYMGSVPLAGWFWSFFFLSLGLPLVLFLWTCGSLSGRPGTIVVVAKKI